MAAIVAAASGSRADDLSTYFPPGVTGPDRAPGVTVRSRIRDFTDDPGVRAGAFIIRAGLDQSFGYDSNLFGFPGGASSLTSLVAPSVSVSSDWSRHRVGLAAGLSRLDAFDQPSQSRTDATVSAGGALDIGRDRASLGYAHLALHQAADQLTGLPGTRPIGFSVDVLRANYETSFGRLTVQPAIEADAYRYDAAHLLTGGTVSQRGRDRDALQAGVTLRYSVAERRNLLVVARGTASDQTARPPGTPSTNSRGAQLLAGIDADLDGAVTARVLLGIERRDFAASVYKSRTAPIAEVEAIWSPSGLTTLTASLTRSIEQPSDEGTAGFVRTLGALVVDHELYRDILLRGSVAYARADYIPGTSTETIASAGAGATWLVRRGARLSADAVVSRRERGRNAPTLAGLPAQGSSNRAVVAVTLHLGL